MVVNPVADASFDGVHYWPEFEDTRNQCSMLSYICCSKCLQKDRNRFVAFHK